MSMIQYNPWVLLTILIYYIDPKIMDVLDITPPPSKATAAPYTPL
jgi:hypothetical protein